MTTLIQYLGLILCINLNPLIGTPIVSQNEISSYLKQTETDSSNSIIRYDITFFSCYDSLHGTLAFLKFPINLIGHDMETNQLLDFKEGISKGEFYFYSATSRVKIEYTNYFKQRIDTILDLKKKREEFLICEDKFNDYELETTVDRSINKRNRWSINFNSTGCFNFDNESIEITYKKKNAYATYKVGKKVRSTTLLDLSKINSLISFEKQLVLMHRPNGSCTTTDVYKINSVFENIEVVDVSCFWDGFQKIKLELGFEVE